jgi:prepilin-type processing-associated H-X9-DG protein/prepilin-type N-terminal cleavage/methylation domain-containing protein
LAFTLVELLVVVAIIAVLLAMLLPGLRQAREVAKLTACLSHQRGIGLAVPMYGNDYRGQVPVIKYNPSYHGPGSGEHYMWFEHLASYLGLTRTSQYQVPLEQLQKSIIWGCPSFAPEQIRQDTPGYAATMYALAPDCLWSEKWSWIDSQSWSRGRYFHLNEWTRHASHAYLTESNRWAVFVLEATAGTEHAAFNPQWSDPERHLGRAGYLMLDGHVETLDPGAGARAVSAP